MYHFGGAPETVQWSLTGQCHHQPVTDTTDFGKTY